MRRRKIILTCVGLILIGCLIVQVWGSHSPSRSLLPPVLVFVSSESGSGVIDDSGAEMTMVRLGLRNPNNFGSENRLYIGNSATEARVSNQWSKVQSRLDGYVLQGNISSGMILTSPQADRCRVSLKYAGTSLSFRMRLDEFLKRKLGRRQDLLPPRFWAWVQSNHRVSPRLPWQEIQLEVEIPPTGQPAE